MEFGRNSSGFSKREVLVMILGVQATFDRVDSLMAEEGLARDDASRRALAEIASGQCEEWPLVVVAQGLKVGLGWTASKN